MPWVAAEFSEAAKLRIKEAASFEKKMRLESFLNLEVSIGMFKVRQITLSDFIHFEYTENAIFENPEEAMLDDFILFLWHLKTSDETRNEKEFAKWAVRNIDFDTESEILAFTASQINDMPYGSSDSEAEIKKSTVSDSSVAVATLIDQVVAEYGWAENVILSMPIARLLQYYQRILKRRLGDKYSITNRITQQARANELKAI